MNNFTLKFGKYKGQQFLSTPISYQNWLLQQDWFKMPQQSVAKYNVIKKFTTDYKIGMGRSKEIVMWNLTWDDAEIQKDMMNMYHLDETIEYFYTEPSYSNK